MPGVQTRDRPMTAEERREIEGALRSIRSTGDLWMGSLCALMAMLLLGMLVQRVFKLPKSPWEAVIAVAAVVVAISVFVRGRLSARKLDPTVPLKADAAAGVAREHVYDVVDAIKVEEFEDEGSNYFLRLADGRVLFLSGQYLYESEDEKRFPSTRVVIVRTPGTGTFLDLRSEGGYLPPTATLPPFSKERLKRGDVPEDGELLEVDFEALRRGEADQTFLAGWIEQAEKEMPR
jgi:hypothetical protein